MAECAEVWADLDSDRDRDDSANRGEDVQMALLDGAAGQREIGGDEIHIEFDPRGTGLLDLLRIVDPALIGRAVEAANDRQVNRFHGAPDQGQVALRPRMREALCWKVA